MITHKQTDDEIDKVQRHLAVLYAAAQRAVSKKLKEYAKSIKEADVLYKKIAEAQTAEEKRDAERAYRLYFAKLTKSAEYKALANDIAKDMTAVNKQAAKYINTKTPAVYVENYNAIGIKIQEDLGYKFQPVAAAEAEKYGQIQKQTIDAKADTSWNVKSLVKSVIAGAVVGKAVDTIFSDAAKKIIGLNRNSADRQASDMMTSAENLGRIHSMYHATDDGFEVKKYWVCVKDNRTRDTHIDYDALPPVDLDYEYNTGLKQPRDPDCGIAAEVCYCRCTILVDTGFGRSSTMAARRGTVKGSYREASSFSGTETERTQNTSYKEWAKWRFR